MNFVSFRGENYLLVEKTMLANMKKYQNEVLVSENRPVLDGFLPLQERDGENAVLSEYAWGLNLGGGIGGLLDLKQGGQNYSYLYDGKGNVAALLDSAQAVVAAYTYDAFGNLMSETGSLSQPFQFSTKPHDEQTGLSYFGYRFYSPAIGRWITRDPIEYAGEINLYAYVENDPVNWVDPLGLWGWDADYIQYGVGGLLGLTPGEGSFGASWSGFAEGWSKGGQGVANVFTGGLFNPEDGLFYDTFNQQWKGLGDRQDLKCDSAFKAGVTGGRVAEYSLLAAGAFYVAQELGIVRINILSEGNIFRIISKNWQRGFRIDPAHHGKPWGHMEYWKW